VPRGFKRIEKKQMKITNYKNTTIAGWMVLFVLLCTSCVEDQGNYDYREINKITISGINPTTTPYYVPLGDSLKITPTLTFSLGEEHDTYRYEWHLMDATDNAHISKAILSAERNLAIIMGGPISASGTYTLMYCVTNATTGVRYDHVFRIVVQDRTLQGYIMLCERENNGFDIDLISVFQDTLTQYHNVLDLFESQLPRTGAKPLDLVCYGDNISPSVLAAAKGKRYAVWVLTDQSTNRLRVENFEYQPEFNIAGISMMSAKYLPSGGNIVAEKMFSVSGHASSGGRNYIYSNGNYFFYNLEHSSYFYSLPVNSISVADLPYKTSPFLFCGLGGAILFDETNNRFEFHQASGPQLTGNSNYVFRTVRLTGGNYFNWQDPDYRLVYLDTRNGSTSRDLATGYAIVKNVATSKYEFLQMSITSMAAAAQLGKMEFPEGFDLESIQYFAYHLTLPYLYCATEDRVYRINTQAMNVFEDITSQVLPSGHKISKMKSSSIRFDRSNLIVVASYDSNGASGKNGQLALYEVEDGTGNLILAKHPQQPTAIGYQIDMKWTGFGKIINVDYKLPQ
jgi:hypothetical protein